MIPPDAATGLNYGLDKVRFIAPVKAGARVRTRVSLISAEPQNGGRVLLKLQCTLEIEGEAKPALVAEVLCMLIGKRVASHDSGRGNPLPVHALRTSTMANENTETSGHHVRDAGGAAHARCQSAGRRAWAGHCGFRAHAARAEWSSNPTVVGAAVAVLDRRARPHRDRRLRACARSQGQALCRSGLEGKLSLPGARAGLPRLGRRAQPLSWTKPRWTSATRSARASSSRCWWTRCRRPTRSAGNPAALKKLVDTGGASLLQRIGEFCRRPRAQRRPAGASRHAEIRGRQESRQPRRARSCTATR